MSTNPNLSVDQDVKKTPSMESETLKKDAQKKKEPKKPIKINVNLGVCKTQQGSSQKFTLDKQ